MRKRINWIGEKEKGKLLRNDLGWEHGQLFSSLVQINKCKMKSEGKHDATNDVQRAEMKGKMNDWVIFHAIRLLCSMLYMYAYLNNFGISGYIFLI